MSSSGDLHPYHLQDNDPHLKDYDETHPWPATLPHFWPRALEDRFVGSQSEVARATHPRVWPRALGEGSQSMELPIPGPRREPSGHADDFHHHQPDTYASDAFEADREWATHHGKFSMQSVELPLENPPSPRTSSRKTWESAGPSTESFAALYRHYVSGEGFAHPKSGLRSGQWSQSVEVPFPARQLEPVSGTSGFQPWDTEHSSEGRADVETAAPEDSAWPGSSKTDGALPTSASSPPPDDRAAPSGAPLLTTRRGVKEWLRRYNVRSSDVKTESVNAGPRTPVLFTTKRYGGTSPGSRWWTRRRAECRACEGSTSWCRSLAQWKIAWSLSVMCYW
ncbi:hypothetical protein C2E23DRAFT_205142 [Lenzites betulinus]|nr:hypothetical protein C2E23DRAFT_205142 [Lenzites betulinus]